MKKWSNVRVDKGDCDNNATSESFRSPMLVRDTCEKIDVCDNCGH